MSIRKYIAEFFGTMVLVLFGCGTAVVLGGVSIGSVLTIALAFGLAIVAAAYAIGNVSGCHVNPAVSLAMLILGKIKIGDFIGYIISQVLGGLAGAGILLGIVKMSGALSANYDLAPSLGQNGFAEASALDLSMVGALVVEVILTFVFVMAIIGVTSNKTTSHMGGLVIGLTLTLVHIIGIPLTGTSVNPARSLAPALLVGDVALSQVWVFIVAPFVGAALAAVIYRFVFAAKKEVAA